MPLRDDPRAASYLWTGAQTPATFNEDITTWHNLVSCTDADQGGEQR